MEVKIEESWKKILSEEFQKPYFQNLVKFVKKQYSQNTVYPSGKNIFAVFDNCPLQSIKVVILGQDPYHGPNQAHGLSFSVPDGIAKPPSLQNIFKEIENDLGIKTPKSGNLSRWIQQGVFLLNTTLTVNKGQAGSHQNKGWEEFTDEIIKIISAKKEHVVFLLWGAYAAKKLQLIDNKKHLVLKAPHPSPLSAHRGFFGCKHFSKANNYLQKMGIEPINW